MKKSLLAFSFLALTNVLTASMPLPAKPVLVIDESMCERESLEFRKSYKDYKRLDVLYLEEQKKIHEQLARFQSWQVNNKQHKQDIDKEREVAFAKMQEYEKKRRENAKRHEEVLSRIRQNFRKIARALTQEKGASTLLRIPSEGFVVYCESDYDISQEVIDQLNRKYLARR